MPRTGNPGGIVEAYSGRTGKLLFTIAEPNPQHAVLGTGVEVIGDMRGDEFPEVAIPRKNGVYLYDLKVGGAYGQGCAGTTTLPTLRTEHPPRVGGSFALEATNLLPTTSGALVTGASDTVWGTTPLPLDLRVMGMTGCQLLCSFDVLAWFTTTSGKATFTFPLPKDYSFLGVPVFNQLWALDAAANPTGVATSNGMRNFVKE